MFIERWRSAVILSALFCVSTAGLSALEAGQVREYWIAADEVYWDFAPSFPINLMSGQEFSEDQRVFVEDGIGRIYKKALYRKYTPGWGELVPRPPEELHLAALGPIIRGEVGDTIVVHFKNNLADHPATIHPHGVFYSKSSEGAPYDDGTSGPDKADDNVQPGQTHTYEWQVPRRAGPGPGDPSSVCWPYHSHADEPADTNGGLIGVIIVTKRNKARPDATPLNVDREFVSLFNIYDENSSLFLDDNIAEFAPGADPDDEDFQESNLMHSINGLLWGNNAGYVMQKGERVRWYIVAMGTEVDLHTPHWHGVTLLHNGNRIDVTEILPAASKTLDLRADNPGEWMYHCHVNDHLLAGMMTKFTILDCEGGDDNDDE